MDTAIIKFDELPLYIGTKKLGLFDGQAEIDANGTVLNVWIKDSERDLIEVRDTPLTVELLKYLDKAITIHCVGQITDAQIAMENDRSATRADRRIDDWKHQAAE